MALEVNFNVAFQLSQFWKSGTHRTAPTRIAKTKLCTALPVKWHFYTFLKKRPLLAATDCLSKGYFTA